MTSLCHICTACSLHCITFKITEFFLLVTANQVSWSLSLECSWFPACIQGSHTLALEKASTHYAQLVLYHLLLSWHSQIKTELAMPYHSPYFFFSWNPSSLHGLCFISSRACCHGDPTALGLLLSSERRTQTCPAPKSWTSLWLWQKGDGNQVRAVWGIHEHKDATVSR